MVEENNKIPDASNDTPKNLHLGEDFEMWLKGREKQKNFLAQKSHLDARSQLADLSEDILKNKGVEKKAKIILTKNTDIPSDGNQRNKTSDFSAFSSFDTRRKSDIGKGFTDGIRDTALVIGGAGRDLVVDFAKLIFFPREQINGTYDYLQDLDSNIEKV